jgi:hypothetical protein
MKIRFIVTTLAILAATVGFSRLGQAQARLGLFLTRQPNAIVPPLPPAATNALEAAPTPAPAAVWEQYDALRTRESAITGQMKKLEQREKEWRDLAELQFSARQPAKAQQSQANAAAISRVTFAQRRILANIRAAAKELELKYPELKTPRPAPAPGKTRPRPGNL